MQNWVMYLEENKFNICLNCGYVFIHPLLKRKTDTGSLSWSNSTPEYFDFLQYRDFKSDAIIFKESIFVCPKCHSDAITEKDKKELVKNAEEKSKKGIEQLGDVFSNKSVNLKPPTAVAPLIYNPSIMTKLKFIKKTRNRSARS